MLKQFSSAIYLRRVSTHLGEIAAALDRQTAVLTRLADHFCPVRPVPDRRTLAADSGVSFLDPVDASLALDFVARTARDTGHTPDEDEILTYIADEKTTDLHKRLVERDEELQRLMESRR
jgi:hypothetical protein